MTDLCFDWPDGSTIFRGFSAAFGAGRTGLVGRNGAGKSTLLRLVAGELVPTGGTVTTTAPVSYLPQNLTLSAASTVAELLGVRAKIDALRAIERGDAAARHFEVLGEDWDIVNQAEDALRAAGLTSAALDRTVDTISGGEAMLTAIAGLRLRATPITLLDEPTNNLDRAARHRLYEMVARWAGTLITVSHDDALLDLMEDTAEVRAGSLTVFGGPRSAYLEHVEQQQLAAAQAQRSAEQVLRTEKRQRVEAETKLARRASYAHKDFVNKRRSKIAMNQRKTEAQVSAGKLRTEFDGKVREAQAAVDAANRRVRADDKILVDLPGTRVPAARRLVELHGVNRMYVLQGPERVALTGPNGVGKTTLLETFLRPGVSLPHRAWGLARTDRIGYLPQRLDGLDEDASVLDNVCAAAPASPPGEVRNRLARFLLRGDAVDRPVRSLSGGERFRVALARLLLAEPHLLVLDEPTNNLDRESVSQLVDALSEFAGALLVVSHDDAFLSRIGITAWLALDETGALVDVPPPDVG